LRSCKVFKQNSKTYILFEFKFFDAFQRISKRSQPVLGRYKIFSIAIGVSYPSICYPPVSVSTFCFYFFHL
jgi:hypothetical protein